MAGVPPWRLHDLRRTAATGMAEIGVAPHIVEAASTTSPAPRPASPEPTTARLTRPRRRARWSGGPITSRLSSPAGAQTWCRCGGRRDPPAAVAAGKNGDLPDWYGPDAPFVEWTIGELMREEAEHDANYEAVGDSSECQEPDKLTEAISMPLSDISPPCARCTRRSANTSSASDAEAQAWGELTNWFRTHTFGRGEEQRRISRQDIYAIGSATTA